MSGRLACVSLQSFSRGKKLVWSLEALVYENEKYGYICLTFLGLSVL